MFPLPAELFRPFSLENSQWHPVRFASWFICHISFISLNSLYLSSGSMHLSWVPQQCLQARSKHILHVTPQLRARLFHPGCVGSMKNWLSDAVNFYSSHHQVFLAPPVSGVAMHLAGCFSFPFFFPSFFWFVSAWKNCKRSISLTWKKLFCWGWVTDTIRWIWKWCDDATQEASQDKFIYEVLLTKKIIVAGVGSFEIARTLLKVLYYTCLQVFIFHPGLPRSILVRLIIKENKSNLWIFR